MPNVMASEDWGTFEPKMRKKGAAVLKLSPDIK